MKTNQYQRCLKDIEVKKEQIKLIRQQEHKERIEVIYSQAERAR